MDTQESLYVILGVEEDASPQQIKSAYKKAALRTHPDRALPERKAEAEASFKRVAEAYEILSKPDTRRRYDNFGTSTSPPPYSSRSRNAGPSVPNFANTFFGTSPDSQPFTFQWESSHDSARRAHAQRGNGNGNRRAFGSVDPFELFNHMFATEMRGSGFGNFDMGTGRAGHGIFDEHPFFASHRRMAGNGAGGVGGFSAFSDHDFDDLPAMPGQQAGLSSRANRGDPFGGFQAMANGFPSMTSSFNSATTMSSTSSTSMNLNMDMSMGGGGVSESRQTRTINGRTETIVKRTDAQGNVTVHTITPESQTVTVNGLDQPNHPLLQGAQSGGAMLGFF